MANTQRLMIHLPAAAKDRLRALADANNTSMSATIVHALAVYHAVDKAAANGHYVGISRDRAALETILLPV